MLVYSTLKPVTTLFIYSVGLVVNKTNFLPSNGFKIYVGLRKIRYQTDRLNKNKKITEKNKCFTEVIMPPM